MRRGIEINSREDLQTTANSYNQSLHSSRQDQQQTKATIFYEADRSSALGRPPSPLTISTNNSNERTKSADHSRTLLNETMPVAASTSSTYTNLSNTTAPSRMSRIANVRTDGTMGTRSSTVYIDELRTTQEEGEKRELNTLNNRFGNYLDKIKNLVNINTNLRRQVDDAYRKYIGHTEEQQHIGINDNKKFIQKYQHPSEIHLNNLRKQINEEVRAQSLIQIRLQRADFDIKFYQNNIKLLTSHDKKQSEQIRSMRQQLEANLQELEHIKRQYERREQDLHTHKSQYGEYMDKLIEFSNEHDKITYERMENENSLHTLKEQFLFEQEFYQRRQQELKYFEKFQYDLNQQFNKNEFHNIVKQIRKDYQEFNEISLAELETLYKTKLDTVRNEFTKREEQQEFSKAREVHTAIDSTKTEHRTLIEQNQLLTDKLEQLQHDLNNIIEQNRQRYEISDREYKQLQKELPELDSIIIHLRENAVNLWSEINTYRYLLLNLLSPTNEKPQQQIPKSLPPPPPSVSINKTIPIEKCTTTSTTTEKNIQESKHSISKTKPSINKVTTTVGTKAKTYPQQYRDETTGFIVHIEDGIIWVRI